MFSELVKRNSRRSRRENGLFFTSLLIAIIAFYIILSLSHQDVMVFLQRMESDAVNRLLTLVPVLYGLTLFILFFLVYYANRFQLARRRHEFGVYLMLGMQRRKLFALPHVSRAANHGAAVVLLEPRDDDGRIQAAGIRQQHTLVSLLIRHDDSLHIPARRFRRWSCLLMVWIIARRS